ncbi:MAG: anaerobic ribonucleoside-triphosphate reductase activating protein [Lachnospiraceae bacterium]|nr:anaerobic ribonucleoside-triphosphate reductase activating protein [Lachnospiraceae bacterium]
MRIHGLNKLTLLDYPGHIACTVFTGSCNLRCPFCQNASLVLFPEREPVIPEEEFFDFLKKRRGMLEGVCVTGGEPTLSPELPDFLSKIKALGFAVKLDTNGTNPGLLKAIVADGLADYVAMDIKSSPDGYAQACGIPGFDPAPVLESADFLMRCGLPFEFRTTVVRELHDEAVFCDIASWLSGARAYYLQAFEDSGELICGFLSPEQSLSGYTKEELLGFVRLLAPHFETVALRGV